MLDYKYVTGGLYKLCVVCLKLAQFSKYWLVHSFQISKGLFLFPWWQRDTLMPKLHYSIEAPDSHKKFNEILLNFSPVYTSVSVYEKNMFTS